MNLKKQLLLFILILLPMMVNADAVEIDGIYYNLIVKAKKAEVTRNPHEYQGEVVIPEFVTYEGVEYNVSTLGDAFSGSSCLTSIEIPNSITSIDNYAFSGCSSLTTVTIPNSVTTIGNSVFDGCASLTTITIPNSVTNFGSKIFMDCSSLTTITIPNSVTTIGTSTFSGCSSLVSIIIPNSVTNIGSSAFSGCSSLNSITIPNSVTNIGNSAFQGCSCLVSITIPNSVISIGKKAFSNCQNLTDVYCFAEALPTTQSDTFDGSYIDYATLHVPEVAYETYNTTAPWSSFGTIKTLDGETPIVEKCATPLLIYQNGKVRCMCETEGVTYVYTITPTSSTGQSTDGLISLGTSFTVNVKATRDGYEDSEMATTTINLSQVGDMDGDGELSITDVTSLVNAILGK